MGTLYGIVVYLWSIGKGSNFVVSEIILGGGLWYFFRCRDTVPLMVFEYVPGRVGGGGDPPCECVPLILLGLIFYMSVFW